MVSERMTLIEIQKQQEDDLKKQLKDIDWHLDYGSVKIQIRAGKPTLVILERTLRSD